jgi:hypothetical protein
VNNFWASRICCWPLQRMCPCSIDYCILAAYQRGCKRIAKLPHPSSVTCTYEAIVRANVGLHAITVTVVICTEK